VPLPFPEEGGTTTGPFPALHGGSIVATLGSCQFFNVGVIRYWYLKNPAATDAEVATFNFAANQPAVESVIRQFNATDPNIDRFLSGGGKVIMVQGTTGMLVPSTTTDPYYKALVDRYRGRIRNTVRYYVQPGYGHGSGAFGLSYDSLSALDAWVTKGAAPANQIAYDGNAATAGRSMPLCDYPAWPRYSGSGDPKLASSFTCVEGTGG
jgi:Tannase and feruloyl esterase